MIPKISQKINLIQPDDWHCHFRDGDFLNRTVTDEAKIFARAIAMPNLENPITTVKLAEEYLSRIKKHIPEGNNFTALMTLYLQDNMPTSEITAGKSSGVITAAKLYPAGATTNSNQGVKALKNIYPLLEEMQKQQMPLLIHGETTNPEHDMFDREAIFIDHVLMKLIADFPELKIVLEHITTDIAVNFIAASPKNVAATITPQHLLYNRNKLLADGLKPHYYCLPILKTERDRQSLLNAATSGNPKFFLGTDSAPHAKHKKESACGCAGIYSAYSAIEIYTQIFAEQDALDKLEAFASLNGAAFYDLPVNTNKITLEEKPWQMPKSLDFGGENLIPLMAGETLNWQLVPQKN